MFSQRFSLGIRLTHHAIARMGERQLTEAVLLDLIESGELRYKDTSHLWIFKAYPERNDNLICVAVVLEKMLVVKTVMHHFVLEGEL
ncbi:MAG: DUF4258 domain-containing protein [Methylophilaceae bacterium]